MFEWIIYKEDETGRWQELFRASNEALEEDVKQLGPFLAKVVRAKITIAGADAMGLHSPWTFDADGELIR